jgi:hypothetical protein
VAVMESADRVLPAVKESNMYATLALLYFDGSSEVEYSLAGHPPILHYREPTRDIARLAMEQFPLGLIPGGRYSSRRVSYSPRDVFLMLTDGISEVPDANDEEFGLNHLEQLLRQNAAEPLPGLWELIMGEVQRHGVQQDDQTLLLLRVLMKQASVACARQVWFHISRARDARLFRDCPNRDASRPVYGAWPPAGRTACRRAIDGNPSRTLQSKCIHFLASGIANHEQ